MRNKRRIGLSLLLAWLAVAAPACIYAQQTGTSEPQTDAQANEQTTRPPPVPAPQQTRPDEQFVPSETISEDLSVPFPVDI